MTNVTPQVRILSRLQFPEFTIGYQDKNSLTTLGCSVAEDRKRGVVGQKGDDKSNQLKHRHPVWSGFEEERLMLAKLADLHLTYGSNASIDGCPPSFFGVAK